MVETSDTKKRVLIVGCTGTVGREVLRACGEREARVRVLLRDRASAATLPAGVEAVIGDLVDDDAVRRALAGVHAAFYVSPHIAEEEDCAVRFAAACRDQSIRMVFLGSHVDGGSRLARSFMRALVGKMLPQFKRKFRLSEAVRQSGADVTLLVPTNFFQNDEFGVVREQLMNHGHFVYPAGARGMNRVDVRDIGDAAAVALLDGTAGAGAYAIAGPRSLTGEECAAIWSAALDADVSYSEDDYAGQRWARCARGGPQGVPSDRWHPTATGRADEQQRARGVLRAMRRTHAAHRAALTGRRHPEDPSPPRPGA